MGLKAVLLPLVCSISKGLQWEISRYISGYCNVPKTKYSDNSLWNVYYLLMLSYWLKAYYWFPRSLHKTAEYYNLLKCLKFTVKLDCLHCALWNNMLVINPKNHAFYSICKWESESQKQINDGCSYGTIFLVWKLSSEHIL